MSTPITSALVVCVAAAGIAAGALFLEADDDDGAAPSGPPAPANDSNAGGYGGGSNDGGGGQAPPAAGAALEISGFQFGAVEVGSGGQVTVENRDSAPHTVTADAGGFDAGVDGGESGSFTAPAQAGTYSFHCEIHPDMSGTLTVR